MPKGRIIHRIADQYEVEINHEKYICSIRGNIRKGEIEPVVGDQVEFEITDEKKGVICEIMPRNVFCKRPKIANITQLVFVVSMKMPKPDLFLLDKQLVFAKWLGVKSVIVLNKTDLVKEDAINKIEEIYKLIGYPVVRTNGKTGEGVEELKKYLQKEITAFSGNSGVGKSSLLNRLFNKEKTQEGLVSQKNKRGKNTTTSIGLYLIEEDSYLADTPGFSTFSIEEIETNKLDQYFVDFTQYRNQCEFLGCGHIKEQNCAVKEAVENGKISKQRYNNYEKMYLELKQKEERKW